jgi:hypothetical protein
MSIGFGPIGSRTTATRLICLAASTCGAEISPPHGQPLLRISKCAEGQRHARRLGYLFLRYGR